ncbi:hypothetical protein B0I35DRAFT_186584 [Stachybotrys elegans]|uniref:Uncharacterized protein n=1 Tax=Stachybotrys elegans TaxID=80388 RepID=A0A8K0WU32_9HYPO|nr:hypothetical protein B0I35DRAFT_186584 [Stachybotrys elegans]
MRFSYFTLALGLGFWAAEASRSRCSLGVLRELEVMWSDLSLTESSITSNNGTDHELLADDVLFRRTMSLPASESREDIAAFMLEKLPGTERNEQSKNLLNIQYLW